VQTEKTRVEDAVPGGLGLNLAAWGRAVDLARHLRHLHRRILTPDLLGGPKEADRHLTQAAE
jgi:hypothetical protein